MIESTFLGEFSLIIFAFPVVLEHECAHFNTLCDLQEKDIPQPRLAEADDVIVPKPAPSLGDRSPGRPDGRLDFPAKASSWLKPLLERQRQQRVRDPKNRYLLIDPNKARHNTPVGKVFVWETVRNASLRVLGTTCNPNTLRKTAGVMFADRAGAGVLHWMGWDDQQAWQHAR